MTQQDSLFPSFLRNVRALAFKEAEIAAMEDEIPIGAVLFDHVKGEIVASAHNQAIRLKDPTAHAEIQVIRKGCRLLDRKRLDGLSIYVTLEPCAMCLGALREAHVSQVYYAAPDLKTGEFPFDLVQKIDDDAKEAQILRDFFKKKRKGD